MKKANNNKKGNNNNNNQQQGENIRVRSPRKGEIPGIVEQILGHGKLKVRCNDKNISNYYFEEYYEDNRIKFDYKIKEGKLADLAPTLLELMGIEKPDEMTGESIIL